VIFPDKLLFIKTKSKTAAEFIMEEDLEYSSQIEEEEDFFFDDDSVAVEDREIQQPTGSNSNDSFRNLLAGPSTNKVNK
jgi:hypothetical protein